MKGAEVASSMFGGGPSTNRTDAISALTANQKTMDEQLKTFLGDDRYAQYKDYQETVGERTLLNQFKLQAGSDYNLNDQQTEAMLTFMKEEQKSVAATTGLPLGQTDKDPAKLQSLFSDGKVDLGQVPDEPNADDAHGHEHGQEDVRPGRLGLRRGPAESMSPAKGRSGGKAISAFPDPLLFWCVWFPCQRTGIGSPRIPGSRPSGSQPFGSPRQSPACGPLPTGR